MTIGQRMTAPAPEAQWPETPEALARLVDLHEPVVFRRAARGWLPVKEEDVVSWLAERAGHRPVSVSASLPGDHGFMGTSSSNAPLTGRRSLGQVLTECARELSHGTGHRIYVQSTEVSSALPEIAPYLHLPSHLDQRLDGHWRIWIGSGEHYVNLHYDNYENLYWVLTGRKTFYVCPFDQIRDVYIGALDGALYGTPASVVDPKAPDLARYPRFANVLAAVTKIDLNPGDVLYLPSHWWHFVESAGLNVSVNFWWSDVPSNQHSASNLAFMAGLSAIRCLPERWRRCLSEGLIGDDSLQDSSAHSMQIAQPQCRVFDRHPNSTLRLARLALFSFDSDSDVIWRVRDSGSSVRVPYSMHDFICSLREWRSLGDLLADYLDGGGEDSEETFTQVLDDLVQLTVLIQRSASSV